MARKNNPKTAPKSIVSAERAEQAIALRKDGHTFREIAEIVGISRAGAHRLVSSVIARRRGAADETAEQMRWLEDTRLDEAMAAVGELIASIDPSNISTSKILLDATDAWIRISESRRKLWGLDAPAKLDVTQTETGVRIVIPANGRESKAAVYDAAEPLEEVCDGN